MKAILSLLICSFWTILSLNSQTPKDFGFRHFQIDFEGDLVDILVSSKKGDETTKKPIFFEVQGSRANPLIVHDGTNRVSSVSLAEGFVENDFHLVLVNKPGLPLVFHQDSITRPKYQDVNTGKFIDAYTEKNYLEYYIRRNQKILKFLKKQTWVDTTKIVIEGHSEGSTIATHMADKIKGITHLIYSGGLPYYPKILAMVAKERKHEDSIANPWVEKTFNHWEDIVNNPNIKYQQNGWESNFGTYSFSQSENEILKRLKIPVLVTYGTKDEASPFNDMFHIETIKAGLKNTSFKAYVGLGHNYQLENASEYDVKTDFLENVVNDWLEWLDLN